MVQRKRLRHIHARSDLFEGLPDDMVISILCKLSSTARCPSDFINILITCKRLNRLGLHPLVLSKAGPETLAVRAKNWSHHAHRFLRQCINAGNTEASYILGMIRFYCLQDRLTGGSLMAKAAIKSHAPALSTAVVARKPRCYSEPAQRSVPEPPSSVTSTPFVSLGTVSKTVTACAKTSPKDVDSSSKPTLASSRMSTLLPANFFQPSDVAVSEPAGNGFVIGSPSDARKGIGCGLWSDFGCTSPEREVHPANRFLVGWFELRGGGPGHGLRLCSFSGCGRPEARIGEFRRCTGVGR
ncbi:unnamed protein product [Ilex paraguariensis]|uniref:At2g35280-like TPR domain-containing protein n=1 Tax=Ilex paraguariensis TaxID=185542 RepID=A0ABC8TDY7_9AQUA